VTNSRIKLSKIVVLFEFRAAKYSILVPTLISCPFHNGAFGHCRDKIEFNLKSQNLTNCCSFEQPRSFCGTCNLAIRFCSSTRISIYFRFSRRPLSALSLFAVPLLWRGAQSRHLLLRVNGNFEFLQTFSSPAFSRCRFLQPLLVAGRGN
jgi:hypothetical protein